MTNHGLVVKFVFTIQTRTTIDNINVTNNKYMIIVANNMKEACQYLEEKKARNRANRLNLVSVHGTCKPFTSEDYKQVKTKMKGAANRKAKTFSVTKYWNHNHLTLVEIKLKY